MRLRATCVAIFLALMIISCQSWEENMHSPSKKLAKTQEVWMAVLPADALVQDGAQWDFVKKHVDGMKFWTQQTDMEAKLWPFQGGVDAPDALRKIIAVLNKNHIDFIIEKGVWPPKMPQPELELMGGKPGPMDDTFVGRAVENELERIRRIEALGGKVRFLDVDGPIRHMLYPASGEPGFPTIEKAAEVFTQYMMGVYKERPSVEFFALTNFPNWGYRGGEGYWGGPCWGDYFTALEATIRLAKKSGAPLRGITIDNPYDYAIGEIASPKLKDPKSIDWMSRVLDVEKYVHDQGLELNMIFNSQRGGEESAKRFRDETLAFIDLYHARGGRPDRYIIQSWYTHPTHGEVVPETDPNTFTGLVKEVLIRVKGIPDVPSGAAKNPASPPAASEKK